ncbi:MAG: hypothetical protein ACLUI3_02500 [Christensenellales bacterium]
MLYGLSYLFTKRTADAASALALLGWRFIVALAVMSLCVALGLVKIRLRAGGFGRCCAWRCFARACISSAKRWGFARRR